MSDQGSTWPEQDWVMNWMGRHSLTVPHAAAYELAQKLTDTHAGNRTEDFNAGAMSRQDEVMALHREIAMLKSAVPAAAAPHDEFAKHLAVLLDIWEDGKLPYDQRVYVEGAFASAMEDIRAARIATRGRKS